MPVVIDDAIRSLAVVLGARHYVRGEHHSGLFQKIMRDHALVSVFDGSTMVNLSALALQLKSLCRRERNRDIRARKARLADIYDWSRTLQPFPSPDLELVALGLDDTVQGLDAAAISRLSGPLAALGRELADERDSIERACDETHARLGARALQTPALFELARRYAAVHAGATCLHLFLHNANMYEPLVILALRRALVRARGISPIPANDDRVQHAVFERLLELHDRRLTFSQFPLAARGNPYKCSISR